MKSGVSAQNPFPGLRPFEPKDSTLFFGRDEQTGEALERLLRQRLLAVVGVSGCGKSSLVAAGMVPALEMGLAGDPEQRWRVAVMRPGDGPLRELKRCLGFGGEALAERTYGLTEAVKAHLPEGDNLLLVVDQFEEIFPFRDRKLHEDVGSEADLFVSYLLRAAQDPVGHLYVLLTMRSDYLGECAKFSGLPEALNDGQYLVPRMTRHQLQEAIEAPLEAAGVEIHPAVVQDLLNQCDEEPDNLPLLQHLLRRLFEQWELAGGDTPITATTAWTVGGLAGALDRDAETVYGGLAREQQQTAEGLLKRITEWRRGEREEEDRPVRRPQTAADLAVLAGVPEARLRDTVRPFAERGLLVVRKTDRGDLIDLPHECLCLKWDRLKGWIRREAEDAKRLRFLLDAVGNNYLDGVALSEALEWQRAGRLDSGWCLRYLTAEQMARVAAWITESRQRAEESAEREHRQQESELRQAREQQRRARVVAIIVGVAFLIAALVGAYAYVQKGEAEKQAASATSGRLAAAALLYKQDRPDLAALLSLEGRRAADLFETRNSLLLSLQANPGLIAYLYAGAPVNCVAFSPDGTLMASASSDHTVRLWDMGGRRPAGAPLTGHADSVLSVAFSPDGRLLASASADHTVRLWDVAARRQLGEPLTGYSLAVRSVAFSPDSALLATGSADGTVRLWDVAGRRQLGDPLQGHSEGVMSVAFSPGGTLLASASADRTVRLWDVGRHEPIGEPLQGHSDGVLSVAFSSNSTLLASASQDHTVRLWDVSRRQQVGEPLQGHADSVSSVAFSPDGKLLVSASEDRTLRLWDVARRQPVGEPLQGHADGVASVAFSPDGTLLASGSADRTVRLWDASRRQPLSDVLAGHSGSVWSVAFSPDGALLASASEDRTVRLWDPARRRPAGEAMQGHTGPVWSVAFSPDGKLLGSASLDQTVRLWDVARRQAVGEPLQGHQGYTWSVAFSPDGKLLASGSADRTVRLWDVERRVTAGAPLEGHANSVLGVAFSPDGKLLASASADRTVRLWDVAARRQAGDPLLGHSEGVLSVAFSPDGKLLASASEDRTVRLWDVSHRRPLGNPLQGHLGGVRSVAFSPDGKVLASASADRTVRLWDVVRRQPLGNPLQGHAMAVWSVAFSPDGKLLASASEDRTVRLWDLDPDSWAARLCRVTNRNLSYPEWQQYIGFNVPYRQTCPALPPGEGVPAR